MLLIQEHSCFFKQIIPFLKSSDYIVDFRNLCFIACLCALRCLSHWCFTCVSNVILLVSQLCSKTSANTRAKPAATFVFIWNVADLPSCSSFLISLKYLVAAFGICI